MQQKPRTPVERAAAAVERAIDRELPELIPTERRGLWVALVVFASKRLREFDLSAEANRGVKPPAISNLEVAVCRCGKPVGLDGYRRVEDGRTEDFCSEGCALEHHAADALAAVAAAEGEGMPPAQHGTVDTAPEDCPLIRE